MPPAPADLERLAALSAALESLRGLARQGAEEVIGHFPEVGDRPAQSAVDGFLEQVADVLRAIEAEATEQTGRVSIAARGVEARAAAAQPSPGTRAATEAEARGGLFR